MKPTQDEMKESPHIKNVGLENLQDDSCARCGGDLTKYSLCAVCKQVMEYICVQCGFRSEWMLHQPNMHFDFNLTRNSMIENTYSIAV